MLAQAAQCLEVLRLSNNQLPPEVIIKMLNTLFANANLKAIHLDISRFSIIASLIVTHDFILFLMKFVFDTLIPET